MSSTSVVLATYEDLLSPDGAMGRENRLTEIQWWRVVCDESHLFYTMENASYDKLVKFDAVSRWLVTGTPSRLESIAKRDLTRFLLQKIHFRQQ